MTTTKKNQDSDVDALTEYQDGRTLEDPEVGPEDNVIPSPYSSQELARRTEEGEGEQVRQELAEAAEGLKSQTHGGRVEEAKTSKTKSGDKSDNV